MQTFLSFMAFLLFMICFIRSKQACAVPKAMTAFMEGVPAPPTEKCFQNRTHQLLASLLRPAEDAEAYYLVEGPHGCGKTTIIRDACHSIGPGVMYVSVPPAAQNFGEELASLIDFEFYEQATIGSVMMSLFREVSAMRPETNFEATERVFKVISCAAIELKKLLGHPPVMVIDDTARLARDDPKVLKLLQDVAKDRADDNTLVVCWMYRCSLLCGYDCVACGFLFVSCVVPTQ